MTSRLVTPIFVALLVLSGCGGATTLGPSTLRITEVMAENDGAFVDVEGETEDYVELQNVGAQPVQLEEFWVTDGADPYALPRRELAPGEIVLLVADDEEDEGSAREPHLPFRLRGRGEAVRLLHGETRRPIDELAWEELGPNESFARFGTDVEATRCEWASPGRANGDRCAPLASAAPTAAAGTEPFAPFTWPEEPHRLTFSELALRPTAGQVGFVELRNDTRAEIDLAGHIVRIASHRPGDVWPDASAGALVRISGRLAPQERAAFALPSGLARVLDPGRFEGVATLFGPDGDVVERVDFVRWPTGAALVRGEPGTPLAGALSFATRATRGAVNDAPPLSTREVGEYVRHLYTPGDFDALAAGGTTMGMSAVKFILDTSAGYPSAGYIMASDAFSLHFDFIHRVIRRLPAYNRCDAVENERHLREWRAFSISEYRCGAEYGAAQVRCHNANRRYLIGTYVHHVGVDRHAIELAGGDHANAEQRVRLFFEAAALTPNPRAWALRPFGAEAVERLRTVEGRVPIMATETPYVGVREQPMHAAVAFGELRFVPATELERTPLGPRVVLVTDRVPNDIGFVGGLITGELQTPLSHVNVLSQNRGTPNLALVGAQGDPRIAPFLGQLVRFEVTERGFSIRAATPDEAAAHHAARGEGGQPLIPSRDLSLRGVVDLGRRGLADLPAIGGKAAQFAELYRVPFTPRGRAQIPNSAFAIPLAHYDDHARASGAHALLESALADPRFQSDAPFRTERLAAIREAILIHPLDAALLAQVHHEVVERFGDDARVRFRSSSNTEDLGGFNGAGLYTSRGARAAREGSIADAIRTVWASLWSERAHDERAYFRVDPRAVGMGILVHAAFESEEGSAIVVSRSVHDPLRADIYTVNTQRGEARVANPAPGVLSEQLDYRWHRRPRVIVRARSTFSPERSLLSERELETLARATRAIHDHFRRLFDPEESDRYFAVEVEAKFADDSRELFIKQARIYPFPQESLPQDCRGYRAPPI